MISVFRRDPAITCARSPAVGRPRSIGRIGAGACTIRAHAPHASFGRMCRITWK
jgi:hypothetical protein